MVLSTSTPSTTTAKSAIHPPCKTDADCSVLVCSKQGEVPECHASVTSPTGLDCHCHVPERECFEDLDCVLECGPEATCDKNACHGNCTHF
ncbi:hypothetical protein DPMN_160704 [Dreissena polymorpha]|uniref:Uncharacterized protein n=1 Tax=Dreissena polymorpha TaxID=45954 RepID=A0A9D4ELA3_DREPO|nr:hypothetical protein DPMN_160704 [Dreissena polymorpha]